MGERALHSSPRVNDSALSEWNVLLGGGEFECVETVG